MAVITGVRKVRVQAAPTMDVHDLKSSTNAQARQPKLHNPIQQKVLDAVPFNIDSATPDGVFGLAIAGGVDVLPSRQNNGCGPQNLLLKHS
jgi:hypothetical protein